MKTLYNSAVFAVVIVGCSAVVASAADNIRLSGSTGCELVLQPTEIRKSDQLSYAFNLLSTTRDTEQKLEIFASISENYTGDISFGKSRREFVNDLSKNISYAERHDFATTFLSPEQLDAYTKCLQIGHGGLAAVVKSFDDREIRIELSFKPTQVGPKPFALRKNVILSGVKNPKEILAGIPREIEVNQSLILKFPREKIPIFRLP